jgi:hypothetical protein
VPILSARENVAIALRAQRDDQADERADEELTRFIGDPGRGRSRLPGG